MRELPILFNGEMVRAILRDVDPKTNTRRVIKPQPVINGMWSWRQEDGSGLCNHSEESLRREIVRFAAWEKGDRLWVRETWQAWRNCSIEYDEWEIADSVELKEMGPCLSVEHKATSKSMGPWRPSIFMPRWASRITLEVVNVRVEPVQDIAEDDAKAEGVTQVRYQNNPFLTGALDAKFNGEIQTAKNAYMELWNSINEKRGFGWNVNPWVWVVEFKRITP